MEHSTILVRTAGGVLGAAFTAAVGLSLVDLAQTPVGWALVAAASLAGLYPVASHLRRGHNEQRLAVGELSAPAADLVTRAVTQAEQLRTLAAASPDGPVAEHFDHLSATADRYVLTLHATLRQTSPAPASARAQIGTQTQTQAGTHTPAHDAAGWLSQQDLTADVERLVADLTELTAAAMELRQAQRRHLEASPLSAMAEQTRRWAEIIAAESHPERDCQ